MHMNMGHPSCKGHIVVENDVWIGAKSTIMSGVKIHNGSIVGANSTVTKDVPPYAIVVGNPAKVVKYRFNERQVESLLKIEWWNWTEDRIKTEAMLMWSDKIDEFIDRHL
jgi:acetyltransferase-like isoleucine patch superfamily enzyme